MKKGLLIIALILAMVLTLFLFPRNKAEAYCGGYIGYGDYFQGAIGFSWPIPGVPNDNPFGIDKHFIEEGFFIYTTREEEPSQSDTIKEKEPSSQVLGTGWGGLPSEFSPLQNTLRLGSLNIFPDIMPPLGIGPIPYPAFPADPEWLWPDFTAMPSSSPILLWTPEFSPNAYWLDVYPMILFYFP